MKFLKTNLKNTGFCIRCRRSIVTSIPKSHTGRRIDKNFLYERRICHYVRYPERVYHCRYFGRWGTGRTRTFGEIRVRPEDIYLKVANKTEALAEIEQRYSLDKEAIMYMGDDIPDYKVMTQVGLPVCPLDACEEIKSVARYISDITGGDGCVRDVISQVLKAKGDWMDTNCYVKSM